MRLSTVSSLPRLPRLVRNLKAGRAACAAPAAALMLWTACVPEAADFTSNGTRDDVRAGDGRSTDNIVDGTSNTIQLGETTPEGDAADGTPAADGRGGVPDAAQQAETIRALTQELSNKFFEFGRSAGNSNNDAFVTGTNQLTLCASGRFQLREQLSFSGDVSFLPDPDDSIGTWAIVVRDDGVPAVELRIEQTTATSQGPVLQFALAADDAGNLFMNGARVFTIEDATQGCQ